MGMNFWKNLALYRGENVSKFQRPLKNAVNEKFIKTFAGQVKECIVISNPFRNKNTTLIFNR